ncbi:MAG: hypothetical protein JO291_01165 [Acidimicrobiia bacterium]|nr:hypothetical protein [Acidimicrobiia bacterium]
MRDQDLMDSLRRHAEGLDVRAPDVGAEEVRSRRTRRGTGRAVLAVAMAVVVIVVVVAIVASQHDDDRSLRLTPPSATSSTPSTATSSSPLSVTTTLPAPHVDASFDALPERGIVVYVSESDVLTLYDMDGNRVAQGTGELQIGNEPWWPLRLVRDVDGAHLAARVPPSSESGVPDCDTPVEGGGTKVAVCRQQQFVSVIGSSDRPVAGPMGPGRWWYAVPSPDGKRIAAQWLGECESPTGFVVATAGGPISTVTGESGELVGGAPESEVIGWTPDGRVIAHIGSGQCGKAGAEPGTHLIDLDGDRDVLVQAEVDGNHVQEVGLWTK